MTKKFFTVALCCMYLANHAWCQNPILRSSTTGVPGLSGTAGSIITQKGDHIGIGTTDPTKRLTLRYATGSVASSGVVLCPPYRFLPQFVMNISIVFQAGPIGT